ncbi:hypothetical protein SAMN06297387_13135 [Streptomyces zhaozhouensis]|uniref:Uncharacterized protein n=1 Tax=Streptomyces zhaozhouensis TaxID=1300267 RepID=A0A286E9C3_9ACTN|nr:hypothetical protein [Streptomyces zhaozhouensis]SOD67491.1 hypothetical protein SAMN06297387_13135 [Streptomyces zhaozhouensis]
MQIEESRASLVVEHHTVEITQHPSGGGGEVGVMREIGRYASLTGQLTIASGAMLWLSSDLDGAVAYLEDCAEGVDELAERMAALGVTESIGAHHEAAEMMRQVVDAVQAAAAEAAEMSRELQLAREDHEADYGPVHDEIQRMPAPMPDRGFLANR